MSYGIIYKATNKINGKSYIGQTVQTLTQRRIGHLSDAKTRTYRKYHFVNALRKYDGYVFDWEVVCECKDLKELNEKEIYYINFYDTYNNGYNCTLGGEGAKGRPQTEETRKKYQKLY